jgi:RIP metalloprotease RseP
MLAVIGGVAGMITLHEFGHYITAKRAGMKVTEFFLFFGPKLWSIKRGETEYGIKLIPAGAYVKIIGMHNLEEVPAADEGRTYRQKSFPRRVSVAVAGSTMHFLLAGVLIWIALALIGQPLGTMDPAKQARNWQIASVVAGTGAEEAGLRPGDRIISFDGKSVERWDDLRPVTAGMRGETVPVVYERDGRRHTVPVTLKRFTSWNVYRIVPGSGPDRAGLKPNDTILRIDGRLTTDTTDLTPRLRAVDGKTVPVQYERDGVRHTVPVEISSLILWGSDGYVGIGRDDLDPIKLSPGRALVRTPVEFVQITKLSIEGLGRFFTPSGISSFAGQVGSAQDDRDQAQTRAAAGKPPSGDQTSATHYDRGAPTSPDEARVLSILGLVQIGSDIGKVDPGALVWLFALINIFIGVFNLVPMLPFDGGHVAIAVYERIQEARLKRRRYFTDVSRLLPLTNVVVILLGLLFGSSIYLDIVNPVQT